MGTTYSTPVIHAVGDVLPASDYNTLANDIIYLAQGTGRAYRAAALTIGTGAITIPIDTISFDPYGNWDVISRHSYNVPTTGYYACLYQTTIDIQNNPQQTFAALTGSGGQAAAGNESVVRGGTGGDSWGSTGADILFMVAGQYIQLQVFNNGGANVTLVVGPANNFLSVHAC